MRPKSQWMIALGGAVLLLGGVVAQASQTAKHEAEELRRSQLSLIEAIVTAEKEGGGKATSAQFVFKRGNPAYFEIKALSSDGSKLTRYELNPRSGTVQKTENERLEKLVTRLTPESLRRSPTTLTHAIAVAQEHSGGHARSADVDRKSDHLEYDIETVKLDGTLHKVKVNGTDGTVIKDESEK
ncbi:MAG: PepSY domain-containing protein [Steroidobacteraceae bacterium]